MVDELMGTSDPVEQARLVKEACVYQYRNQMYIRMPGSYLYNFWWPWLKGYHGECSIGGRAS